MSMSKGDMVLLALYKGEPLPTKSDAVLSSLAARGLVNYSYDLHGPHRENILVTLRAPGRAYVRVVLLENETEA